MSSFVCAQVVNNQCAEWVQTTFLLPPLSIPDALQIGGAFLAACVVAWGIQLIAAQLIPR